MSAAWCGLDPVTKPGLRRQKQAPLPDGRRDEATLQKNTGETDAGVLETADQSGKPKEELRDPVGFHWCPAWMEQSQQAGQCRVAVPVLGAYQQKKRWKHFVECVSSLQPLLSLKSFRFQSRPALTSFLLAFCINALKRAESLEPKLLWLGQCKEIQFLSTFIPGVGEGEWKGIYKNLCFIFSVQIFSFSRLLGFWGSQLWNVSICKDDQLRIKG